MKKRLISVMLAALMLMAFGAFAACGKLSDESIEMRYLMEDLEEGYLKQSDYTPMYPREDPASDKGKITFVWKNEIDKIWKYYTDLTDKRKKVVENEGTIELLQDLQKKRDEWNMLEDWKFDFVMVENAVIIATTSKGINYVRANTANHVVPTNMSKGLSSMLSTANEIQALIGKYNSFNTRQLDLEPDIEDWMFILIDWQNKLLNT